MREQDTQRRVNLEKRGMLLSSPLLVAVASALFGLIGTGFGATLQGKANFQLERQKFEFSIIRQALEIKDRKEAAKQLLFLVNSGVIQSLDSEKLRKLANEPDKLPVFPELRLSEEEARTLQLHLKTHGSPHSK